MRELDKKLDLLMDYLGLEFRYAWGEPVSITKCEKSAHQNLTKCDFTEETKPTKDQDTINWLRSENAFLIGIIRSYEKFLKDKGYIKEEE